MSKETAAKKKKNRYRRSQKRKKTAGRHPRPSIVEREGKIFNLYNKGRGAGLSSGGKNLPVCLAGRGPSPPALGGRKRRIGPGGKGERMRPFFTPGGSLGA